MHNRDVDNLYSLLHTVRRGLLEHFWFFVEENGEQGISYKIVTASFCLRRPPVNRVCRWPQSPRFALLMQLQCKSDPTATWHLSVWTQWNTCRAKLQLISQFMELIHVSNGCWNYVHSNCISICKTQTRTFKGDACGVSTQQFTCVTRYMGRNWLAWS
jgi:hypothetical protein